MLFGAFIFNGKDHNVFAGHSRVSQYAPQCPYMPGFTLWWRDALVSETDRRSDTTTRRSHIPQQRVAVPWPGHRPI